jgi:hypothetical protein
MLKNIEMMHTQAENTTKHERANTTTNIFLDANTNKAIGTAIMAAAMVLLSNSEALAQDANEGGIIAFKYLDYLDSQPGIDRVRVRASALRIQTPVVGAWAVGATMTTDGISGASPAYHSAGLGKLRDRRNAMDVEISRFFDNASLTIGRSYSKEEDYVARGFSTKVNYASEDRNTNWSAAIAASSDEINPSNHIVRHETKHVTDVLVSVSQVLSSDDLVLFSVGASNSNGYHSDPYKVFDNRPRSRKNLTLMSRWNHHFETLESSLRLSYRYFSDSWKIKAHTIGAE